MDPLIVYVFDLRKINRIKMVSLSFWLKVVQYFGSNMFFFQKMKKDIETVHMNCAFWFTDEFLNFEYRNKLSSPGTMDTLQKRMNM